MSAFDRQRRTVLKILGKTFFKVIGVGSAKFGNEAHFVSFAAIVAIPEMGQRARISISETL
jgi:hypothetical protein